MSSTRSDHQATLRVSGAILCVSWSTPLASLAFLISSLFLVFSFLLMSALANITGKELWGNMFIGKVLCLTCPKISHIRGRPSD